MFEQHQTTNRSLTAGGGSISNRQMAHFPSPHSSAFHMLDQAICPGLLTVGPRTVIVAEDRAASKIGPEGKPLRAIPHIDVAEEKRIAAIEPCTV